MSLQQPWTEPLTYLGCNFLPQHIWVFILLGPILPVKHIWYQQLFIDSKYWFICGVVCLIKRSFSYEIKKCKFMSKATSSFFKPGQHPNDMSFILCSHSSIMFWLLPLLSSHNASESKTLKLNIFNNVKCVCNCYYIVIPSCHINSISHIF